MADIEVYNTGVVGVIKDKPAHYLPPEVWTDGNNFRFQDGVASKFKGHASVFGTPTVTPGFLLPIPTFDSIFWIYTSLTKAYVYESGTHTNITRQTAMVDVDYDAQAYRDWNGGILGGIPILNNFEDVPQYWGTLNTSAKLADLSNWPSTLRAKILRPFGPFLVALNITDNGDRFPHMFWWSHPADPGSLPVTWDYTDDEFDAGRKELTDVEGGEIIDALMLKNLLIIYKETSTHYMRYVGGQEVMANDLLWAGSGILAARCRAVIKSGSHHFVATADDVIAHNGQTLESVIDKNNRKYLQRDIDSNNYINSFCVDNPAQREAWFCYPAAGAEYPNKALVWNYNENTIQFRDFVGNYAISGSADLASGAAWSTLSNTWEEATSPWSAEGRRQVLVSDPNETLIYMLDSGESFNGEAITCFLERKSLAFVGKDRQGQPKADFQSMKLCTRLWPKIVGLATVTVRLGVQDNYNAEVSWSAPQEFNPVIDTFLDFTVTGRLYAIRFEATTDLPLQIDGYTLEVELISEF